MFYLTKQERVVVLSIIVIILCGSLVNYSFKKYPELKDIVNLLESNALYPKIDINSASAEELESIPYIGQYTAQNIIYYREKFGLFNSIEEIKKVKGIRFKNYERFAHFLKVS